MKFIKIFTIIVFFLIVQTVNSQSTIEQAEILISNKTTQDILLKVYPVGAVFSGFYTPPTQLNEKYSLKRSNQGQIPFWTPDKNDSIYITGGNKIIEPNGYCVIDFDDGLYYSLTDSSAYVLGGISYGLWKFEFYSSDNNSDDFLFLDEFLLDERDVNHGQYIGNGFSVDLLIYLAKKPYASKDSLFFSFYGGGDTVNISDSRIINKTIKAWHKVGIYSPTYGQDPLIPGSPNRGQFESLSNFTTYPIYATEYGASKHLNPGDIDMNLQIDHDIGTRDTLIDTITNITVKKKAAMIINSGKTFNMITPSFGYNNLIVEDTAYLILYNGAKIIVDYPNKLTLKNNSNLTLGQNSEVRIDSGGIFCNEGGIIRGPGKIIIEKGIHEFCSYVSDFKFEDSTKFILEDSAVVVLPDEYTLHLKGNTTSLIMNPGSKLMFGENSGIVCDSGAKVIANGAAFTSSDSTKNWNGISLRHRSQDTIKNCMISNAQYGIMIFRKNDDEETEIPYSTEISGCNFVNKSGSELSIAVYAANSNNFLIMNNSIYSTILTKGFAQGIYTEFCSGGNVNFIGNTINNTGNGMTLVNSSPFVSQNTINGNQYSESGIFLDNSNGKFEYNIINDFYYSIYSMLSSPDLLKNVFNNSYTDNILLTYSSTPNLQPVLSGGNTYWLSGDNLIDGEPSNAGIFFEDDSYPNMAYGYNRFTLSNNTYDINGTTNFTTYFDVRENYWGTLSPDTGKFSVENSLGILYSPFDDNSSGQRSVNNYTLYDIGFGLKDTVFFLEGDNPVMANELYLDAYQKENLGEYPEAIEIYKEIISYYKDSVYAISSLSRLFNCHEKKNSTVSEFNSLQNFYSDIFEDTSYSETQRNLSEDFIIKSKVKRNNVEEAISDYNTIYTNNMNTAKGTHALINMEILSAGTGDNLSGNNEIENLGLKQSRINDILSNVINKKSDNLSIKNTQPERFLLSQNYPNPFNPSTNITYSIPVSGNVTIKIFDITGREIKSLVNEFRNAGSYEVTFDGSGFSSGVYYYRLETKNYSEIKKMILIK